MKYKGIVISHNGKTQTNNEDNAYLNEYYQKDTNKVCWRYESESENNMLAAVFDGMGGADNGEIASIIAAKTLAEVVDVFSPVKTKMKEKESTCGFSKYVDTYVDYTNKKIVDFKQGSGMGTTCSILSIENDIHYFFNLGDSRGYLFRNGMLEQKTKDHNMVTELIKRGILSKEQANRHPDRHAIYQYLGMNNDFEEIPLEIYKSKGDPVKINDIFMLCSDGLIDMVCNQKIEEILKGDDNIKYKAESLLENALINGGKDNITILLIEALE